MKRKPIYCAVAIAAALALGAMAGCGSQPASQSSASSASATAASSASATASQAASESASTPEAIEKSQDEIIAELKESISKVPAYKSVSITEKTLLWTNYTAETAEESSSASAASSEAASSESAEAEPTDETLETSTLYKFDETGDKPKTSAVFNVGGVELQYYTDGDDAVCVTDGPVYSGTAEQFGLVSYAGAEAYLKETIGDLNTLVDCTAAVTQDDINGVTGYELILDPKKYIESDETLKLMADYGDPVQAAYITVGFDKDGNIVWMTKTVVFTLTTSSVLLDLTDFDSTVVDPMPEATNTYEEMNADVKAKLDALSNDSDLESLLEDEAGSADEAGSVDAADAAEAEAK